MDPMVGSLIEEFRDELPVPTIKVSTSFPRNNRAMHNMSDLIRTANSYAQEGGIIYPQVSLHSTEDHIRQKTTRMPLLSQDGIQSFGNAWYKNVGVLNGIKPALAFTLSDDSARHCSASDIVSTLPPERFAVLVRGQLVKGKDLLSEESFDDLRADFESHGYLFVDGKATVLEILHDTEVDVWETLEKHSDTETYSQSANSIHTLSL